MKIPDDYLPFCLDSFEPLDNQKHKPEKPRPVKEFRPNLTKVQKKKARPSQRGGKR